MWRVLHIEADPNQALQEAMGHFRVFERQQSADRSYGASLFAEAQPGRVVLYASPAAAEFTRLTHGWRRSSPPVLSSRLSLLAGDARCWDLVEWRAQRATED